MCTVTYIPSSDGFYLTSSRDESMNRPTITPQEYEVNDQILFHPKDEKAGGTWISVSNKGRAACLLNGAFKKHKKENHYKKSRGLILLDSFNSENISVFVNEVDLDKVEPFTLLLLDFPFGSLETFCELKWDGREKHIRNINPDLPQLWSSPTLYSFCARRARRQLFNNWLTTFCESKDKMIFSFHQKRHGLKDSDDILMDRGGDLKTLSISQVHIEMNQVYFNYHDIIDETKVSWQIVNKVKFYA